MIPTWKNLTNGEKRMLALYPDTELVPFDKARELGVGGICTACPGCYPQETGVECAMLPCAAAKVYVSPTLYLVAKVNKWGL